MQPVVKQPIHDEKGEIWGYELLYSSNERWSEQELDREAATALEGLLLHCSNEDAFESQTICITFSHNFLLRKVPEIFHADSLVIQIDQDILLSNEDLRFIQEYRSMGYRVALIGFDYTALYLSALPLVDYVKLNFSRTDQPETLKRAMEVIQGLQKEVIGTHINTAKSYDLAAELRVPYMQGIYIAAALPAHSHNIDHLPGNFFELMVALFEEEPDINRIAEIISRDVTLTYSILKLVNSAFFSLRTKVNSISHALMILGLAQLKQWIYLLSFKPEGNVPTSFIKLSLLRANFCRELHPYAKGLTISADEAALIGMFSTIDALLQRPMADVLQELSISSQIKNALLKKEGQAGLLYALTLSYETGDWHRISDYAEQLGVPTSVLSQKYFACLETVNALWNRLVLDRA